MDRKYSHTAEGVPHDIPRAPGALEISIAVIVACGIGGLLIGVLSNARLEHLWRWGTYGLLAPIALLVLACLVYLALRSYNAGMWAIERRTGRDLDGDGSIGAPHLVMVNPRQGQDVARRQTAEELRAEFERFIRGCELSTGMAYWNDQRVDRPQYREFRDALLGAGYAAWNSEADKRQGWRLLLPAEQIIEELWRQ